MVAIIEPFEKYTKKYEDWFLKHKFAYQSEIRAIKEIMPTFEKGIEIGVGSGRFAEPLGIKFGIEPSRKMAAIAKKRGIKIIEGTAENLQIKDCSFDLALMVTTLCFLEDAAKAFSQIHRILKPGSYFVNGFVDKESKVGRIYQKHKEKNVFYKYAKFYSVKEALDLLKNAGFKNFKTKQTIFKTLDKIDKVDNPKDGYGEGSFVVIKAFRQ